MVLTIFCSKKMFEFYKTWLEAYDHCMYTDALVATVTIVFSINNLEAFDDIINFDLILIKIA